MNRHEVAAEPTPAEPYAYAEQHEAQVPEDLLGDGTWLRRIIVVLSILVALGLMVVLPPLVNVSRYRRQISTSISASLGRPVHLDSVTLNVLPLPGFTLNNFVVTEDPAFGTEPVIRANTVRATLRISSLWRRHVEFSTISLTEPSVNLVHLPDGRWNLESILLQASRMPVAPTAQKGAGQTQRFPYIEATDARVNLKQGDEKVPFALTEAEFALWLSEPEHWQLRLEAHPARTDTSVSDTGVLRVEGTLGRAATRAGVPVNLTAEWSAVPLGSVSLIALGRDLGMRGEMTLTASARGTVGEHVASTRVQLTGLRRSDFVPDHSLDVDVRCSATATKMMHSLQGIRCNWPTADKTGGVVLTGDLPDLRQVATASGELKVKAVPASTLLAGLHVASTRVPRDLTLSGVLDGSATMPQAGELAGSFVVKDAKLALGKTIYVKSDLVAKIAGEHAELQPVAIDLGGREPATLTGAADRQGFEIGLRGTASPTALEVFGAVLPQAGTLPVGGTATIDDRVRRGWRQGSPWTLVTPVKPKAKGHRHRR
ncbi:AsmA family protein [Granulicella sp. WH15]|uniref:AsmA family protein n=1 Tax=Granulicella sp. WH15 TaxID=2602070 RepID=UPI0013A52D00|nr:AsmA family protein [Granulicella sp. WH15]